MDMALLHTLGDTCLCEEFDVCVGGTNEVGFGKKGVSLDEDTAVGPSALWAKVMCIPPQEATVNQK